jgi:signal transduction histidine kinase
MLRLKLFLRQLSLAQRFMLVTLLIMIAGMFGLSNWVGSQIEAGVVHQNGTTVALSVDSFVTPQLQSYGQTGILDQGYIQTLNTLLGKTSLGKLIVAFTVRDMTGRALYSTDASMVGILPPTPAELSAAARGEVTSEIDLLEAEADTPLKKYSDRLSKTYSPVRIYSTGKIFAIIEFYQEMDTLQVEIDAAKRQSWIVVGAFMAGMYLLLALFSKRTSDTIDRQKEELNNQVARLTDLLDQNQQLHGRVRQAAASIATLHERLLRRVGSELHDGPAQDLSLALMQIDTVISQSENNGQEHPKGKSLELLTTIETALKNALTELRAISSGLSLPQLAGLSTAETIAHAARAHERRTGTKVNLDLKNLPEQLPLPVKITVYRLVQEALNNIFKHAGGVGQQVNGYTSDGSMIIQISDQGPGFNVNEVGNREGDHLGLEGMRERVESLGGRFQIESQPDEGTKISAILNLQTKSRNNE